MTINPGTIFNDVVKGKNFMTPDVLRYYPLGDAGAIELSHGTGIDHEPLFGVTVVTDGKQDHPRSHVYFDRDEAEAYIATVIADDKLSDARARRDAG